MRLWRVVPFLFSVAAASGVGADPAGAGVRISEFVTDPQHDWDGSGIITGSDEWFELENGGNGTVALAGWRLELIDTTPATAMLAGELAPGARLVVRNPPGEQNNHGRLVLRNAAGDIVDELRHGTWEAGAEGPRADGGDASGPGDEALARDGDLWRKTVATPGAPNFVPLGFLLMPAGLMPVAGGAGTNASAVAFAPTVLADPRFGNATAALLARGPDGEGRHPANASVTVPLPTDGWYEIEVETSNARGNWTWPERPLRLLRDATPPVAPAFALPSHANGTLMVAWPAAADEGVGGVQYRVVLEAGNVTTSSWSAFANATVATPNGTVAVRVEARDALGNRGVLASRTVGYDPAPPEPLAPGNLTIRGERDAALAWAPGRDGESYLASYRIARVQVPGEAPALFDAGNRTTWTDRNLSLGQPAWYQAIPVDAAGNAGPVSDAGWVRARLGMHTPRPLLGVSATGSAEVAMRVRAEFDRPMGGTPHAEFRGEGAFAGVQRTIEGAWDADGRGWTGTARWPAFVRSVEGRAWFGGARDAYGNEAPTTASAPFLFDGEPPVTAAPGDFATWVKASRFVVHVQASDDLDPAPSLEVRTWREGTAEPRDAASFSRTARVTLDGDGVHLVKYRARDASGNREAWRTLRVGLDGTPPTAKGLAVADGRAVEVRLGDSASGLAPETPKVWLQRDGWRVPGAMSWDEDAQVATFESAIALGPGPTDVLVDVQDRAGNRLLGRIGTVRGEEDGGVQVEESESPMGGLPPDEVLVGGEATRRGGSPTAEGPESVLAVTSVDDGTEAPPRREGVGLGLPSVGAWLPATGLLLASLLLRRRVE